ncbi:MAG: 23S rRNA (adenine(2503)-C(2))-methyltransferase RlmN [Bdellovibrionaceae bacterium]|nr:23S rRNA (adenine(2503)-C(2))-methyltransferase RlmN [Pseudobdellovibrionaceae bacterium]
MTASFFQFSLDGLKNYLVQHGCNADQARLLFNWHYKKNKVTPCEINGLSTKTKEVVNSYLNFNLPLIDQIQTSEDRTVKFLFSFQDGKKVETVIIPFNQKYTVCLSSQVGCAMNCSFCYTGTQGLTRSLKTEEIIGQFLAAQTWLTLNRPHDNRILNVVFMGQGEPLHNFDNVKTAVEILISQHGLSLADHKITISTSGYLPGLLRWKDEMPSVNIALSLHSPVDEKRSQLIPINKKYPLKDVIPLIEQFPQGKKRFVTYEYLLIHDFNDSEEDALQTAQLLVGTKAFMNLIPFNPFPGTKWKRPSTERIQKFFEIIESFKIPVTIRTTKGDKILAACGQLNSL